MRFGIGFILFLLFLGGFAAYQGDRVGMAVGRKRLSIFGLRPKYTSRLVSVLTGVIIVLLTMTSLLMISHTARQSLFGLEELQATIADLSRHVTSLENRQQILLQDNENLQAQNAALRQENETLAATRAELEAANAALREEQRWLEGRIEVIAGSGALIIQNLMQTPLVYEANEVIDSHVIDVPETREELVARVYEMLERTNAKVLADGAGEVSPGWALALGIFALDETGEVTMVMTEEEHVEQLVEAMWSEPGLRSVLVQVISRTHTFEGSPVDPDFRLFVNTRVFEAGETVHARVFDSRQPGPALFNQLWSWLQGDIHQIAKDRGLLGRPDGTVTAAIEPGVLFEVVERIKAAPGLVRVRAVAARDVMTGDELPLEFAYDIL